MTAINITITSPWGDVRGDRIDLEAALCVKNAISEIRARLGWPEPEAMRFAGELFVRQPPRLSLYAPRWGVLNADRTLQEQAVEPGSVLHLYASPAKPAELALSAIQLSQGDSLSAMARCVIVEWQDRTYPVILPAHVAAEGQDGMLWLADVVSRQIADISGQAISTPDWTIHRCYNVQKQRWIGFTETMTQLGDQISHGDHLRLVQADEIVILDELEQGEHSIEDSIQVHVDDDLLSQISIQESDMGTLTAITLGNARLELVKGDLTHQTTDAIVNAAKTELTGGGGVDGAIHRAAGPALVKASAALAPCPTGEAVLTPGFRLPCRWVIHTVGPVYEGGSKGEAQLLANAYRNSLQLAINSSFVSIAFPSISTGVYGYPVSQAARIALKTVTEVIRAPTTLELVRFVLFSDADYLAYRSALKDIAEELSIAVEEGDTRP